ncbi:hypothetical protein ZHAS_00021794 [Anopheles sinensis]|uniref:Uncharacterized protein n=1 Tax=Anopheles sinensis TaxID=74873 RepID=A0A084WT69_ANOSI|nr:hypothetical protein ZHAS_00021794 [Anopheles sinensis]
MSISIRMGRNGERLEKRCCLKIPFMRLSTNGVDIPFTPRVQQPGECASLNAQSPFPQLPSLHQRSVRRQSQETGGPKPV